MLVTAISTPKIKPGDDVLAILLRIFRRAHLRTGEVITVTSKILSYAENRLVRLSSITPSQRALRLCRTYHLDPSLAELIIREQVRLLGGVAGAILTESRSVLVANAGIDLSNTPKGYAILWPHSPHKWADIIYRTILKKTRKKVGIIITDSVCFPRRRGTYGIALAIAGFEGIRDERGKPDLFGKTMRLTTVNIADTLATAANLSCGERNERKPIAIIQGVPVKLSSKRSAVLTKQLVIRRSQDLFNAII